MPTCAITIASPSRTVCLEDAVENLASNLRAICRRKGIRGRQIALALGVKPSTVSRWMNAKAAPEIKTLGPLADFLGVTVVDLLSPGEGERSLSERQIRDLVEAEVRTRIALEIEAFANIVRTPKHRRKKQ